MTEPTQECYFGLCRATARWEVVHPLTGLRADLCTDHVEIVVTWGMPDPESAIREAVVLEIPRPQRVA